MAAGCVYGYRQLETWRAGRGFSCRRRLARTLDAVIMGTGVGFLAGVGCRMTDFGPRLGTLLGTLQRRPMCASHAHIALSSKR